VGNEGGTEKRKRISDGQKEDREIPRDREETNRIPRDREETEKFRVPPIARSPSISAWIRRALEAKEGRSRTVVSCCPLLFLPPFLSSSISLSLPPSFLSPSISLSLPPSLPPSLSEQTVVSRIPPTRCTASFSSRCSDAKVRACLQRLHGIHICNKTHERTGI
jgi:hypothetical protein